MNWGISPCHSMRRGGIGLRPRSQALRPDHLKIHPTRVLLGGRGDGTGWQGLFKGVLPAGELWTCQPRLTHEPEPLNYGIAFSGAAFLVVITAEPPGLAIDGFQAGALRCLQEDPISFCLKMRMRSRSLAASSNSTSWAQVFIWSSSWLRNL